SEVALSYITRGRVMRKWLRFGVLALISSFASAQNYPERPIRIIVPLTPGGSPDTIARAMALGLQSVWAQPVVVENRPGGSQNIGADLVAKSRSEEHTSELQSRENLVCRLLLEKKKTNWPAIIYCH